MKMTLPALALIAHILAVTTLTMRAEAGVIYLFNDCYGPTMEVTLTHPSNEQILYQGTPPIGSLLSVDTKDAQIVECTFNIPRDQLGATTVLEEDSHVLLQDYLELRGRHVPRIGIIAYLTDGKGTIISTLFQL